MLFFYGNERLISIFRKFISEPFVILITDMNITLEK